MKQTLIIREHNNFSDGFQTINPIVKNTTKQIHYCIIGWGEIETTDFLYKEITLDNERFNEQEVLNKHGYTIKIEPRIP